MESQSSKAEFMLSRGHLTRRRFLRLSLTTGAVGFAPGLVAGCSPTGTTEDSATTVSADTTSTPAPGSASSTEAPASATVTLRHDAGVGPIIEPYVEDFNERYDDVELASDFVPQDYFGVTQTQLAAGDVGFDVFFGDPANTQKWYDAGFIRALDDLPDMDQLLADLAPGTEDLLRSEDGNLMAVPYFVGVELFAYNSAHLDAIGADVPTTWDEFLDVARELKAEGVVDTPYSPFWSQDFDIIWWDFVAEVFSDGGEVFGPTGEPAFLEDPAVRSTLERWRVLYQEGLVPADIFTTSYGDLANVFAGGRSTFTIRYAPELRGFTDDTRSQVADDVRLALIPGSTQESYRWLGTWMITADSDEPEAWEVLQYLAYKDREGEFYVPSNLIAGELSLLTAYPAVNSSPEVQDIVRSWTDPAVLADQIDKSRTVPVEKAAWFAEFRPLFAGIMQDMIRGNVPIEDGLAQAADFVNANR